MTPAEQLAFERASEVEHEDAHGAVFAMSGGTRAHSLLAANLTRELGNAPLNRPCELHTGDLRVKIAATGRHVYPEATVACRELAFEDDALDTLLNPTVIVEVPSDPSEAYDRGDEFEGYRSVSSVTDEVLVSQKAPRIEHHRREPDGAWRFVALGPGDALVLDGLGVRVRVEVDRVYHEVALTPAEPAAG